MKSFLRGLAIVPALLFVMSTANAANYPQTVSLFKNAGESGTFFDDSYAYAVFPTIGAGGLGVGGAHGKGRVYIHGKYAGAVTMSQISVGLQAGAKAYSQIIFFKDKRALEEFESGNFEFGADANVVAVTAGAGAHAATNGTGSGSSAGTKDATTKGEYYKGMAVFSIAKGGLMFEASIAGQKFTYTPAGAAKTE